MIALAVHISASVKQSITNCYNHRAAQTDAYRCHACVQFAAWVGDAMRQARRRAGARDGGHDLA